MKTLALWSLVAANVVLGSCLLAKYGKESTAVAQVGRPSEYLMVPGSVVGGNNAVIYIVDMSNGMLGAMSFDPTKSRFDPMAPIDLNRLFDTAAQGGAGGAGNPRAPRR
jgi:hypothetical protein